jgi:phospholipid-transporting ATPase
LKDGEEEELRAIEVNRPNLRTKQVLGCCSKRVQRFPNNKVTTARYNVFTFLPLNLMVQLSKLTNLYFLVLSLMELYKPISDSGGKPIILIPLSFIIAVSLVKDLFEDFARKTQDRAENNRCVLASSSKPPAGNRASREASGKGQSSFQEIEWQNIRVGNIVKVMENQYFPCDVLLVNSSLPKGICYVETKNLDGETNLKHKQAPKQVIDEAENDQDVQKNFQEAVIECEKENEFLYRFQGNLKMYENKEDLVPLSVDNMCMRGSSLRNTEWVYGIAIYTGHQTKVMMNSSRSAPKYSVIEKKTNQYLIFGIFLQTVLCLGCAAWYVLLIWLYERDPQGKFSFGKGYQATYLLLDRKYTFTGAKPVLDTSYTIATATGLAAEFATSFGTWFLAM